MRTPIHRATPWFLGSVLLIPLALIGLPGAQDPAPIPPEPEQEGESSGEEQEETPSPAHEDAEQAGGEAEESSGDEESAGEEERPPAPVDEEPADTQTPVAEQESEPPEPPAGKPEPKPRKTPKSSPEKPPQNTVGGEEPPPPSPGFVPGAEPPTGIVDPVGATEPEPTSAPATVRKPLPTYAPEYRGLEAISAFVDALVEAAPPSSAQARRLELGRGFDGSPVPALEFGALGPLPLEERPTVLLIGGLDGRSLAGGEAVLGAAHTLLAQATALPANATFIAVPWAAPEPLSRSESGIGDGRNSRPTDDDRDGRLDDDPPDDLDGDGMILEMLIEQPDGPWVRGGDGRFLVPAQPGAGTRYVWTREGRDDDGDGRFNEDGLGGVVLDRNFPVHREGPWRDPSVGQLPMSEDLVRALADLARSRRTVLVLLFQGNHGALATPNAPAAEDAQVYRRVTEAFLAATGRSQSGPLTMSEAQRVPCPGAAIDWFHEVLGALALEVAPWGPMVESGGPVVAQSAQFSAGETGGAPRALEARPRLGEREQAWAAWLDNTRGGLGFVDWQPVELGGGRQGLVGGWQPFTIQNPPPETLPTALEGLPQFVADLGASLPRLEIRATSTRDGDLCRVSAQVKNLGLLPTGLVGTRAAPLTLDLKLPAGARLVAGETRVRFDRLLGRELSAQVDWVVIAPAGSVLRLSASSDWTGVVVREVEP